MYTFCRQMKFSTIGKIKVVASNYVSIRANINTAGEKNFAPIWYEKLMLKYCTLMVNYPMHKSILNVKQ